MYQNKAEGKPVVNELYGMVDELLNQNSEFRILNPGEDFLTSITNIIPELCSCLSSWRGKR